MNGYFSHVDAKKAIVFLPSLLQLFAICNVANCGSYVDSENIVVKPNGLMLKVECFCNNNHKTTWESGPMLGSGKTAVAAINAIVATYTLTCGLHIQQVIYEITFFSIKKIQF